MEQSNDATRRVLDALEQWASQPHADPLKALAPVRALCDPSVTEDVFLCRAIEHAMVAGNVANLEALRAPLARIDREWVSHALTQGHGPALAWLLEQPVHRQWAQAHLPWCCNHLVREATMIDGVSAYKELSACQLSELVEALASLSGFADQLRLAIQENRQDRETHGFGPPLSGKGFAILEQAVLDLHTPSPRGKQTRGARRL